ncbi:TetR/AcrR family transcriptional regulator [Paenibacillus sp. 1P07SE]|uniref:TetR/AcrR family transcriptional regulator n=1 Tax=Paenibacillus sp. 1P07SE TaxID=3132209 RepID=UPI0039A5BC1C
MSSLQMLTLIERSFNICRMRHKDEHKNQAIFDATIQLINEVGFADVSMSKIAKRAGLSSATIYVYYESKEDLLLKLYLNVKEKMSRTLVATIHEGMDSKQVCYTFMKNALDFMIQNKDWFLFIEQFSASPFVHKLCLDDTKPMFEPLLAYFQSGTEKGELKQARSELLASYCYLPLVQIAKSYYEDPSMAYEEERNTVFLLSWDAIRS